MKALVLKEYNKFAYEEVPTPEFGPKEVLIKVKACGICGSDVHGMDGSTGRRIPPIIMGHEASGVIETVGVEVRNFKAGDRVTFDSMISCKECSFCLNGRPNLCDNRRVLGVSCGDYRQHGAFAEFVAVPEHILFRLPEGLSFEHAAMVEPVSIAFHAVNMIPREVGDSVVVVGAGMIGLFVIQALRLAGYGKIIALDLDPAKLELAKQLGADYTFVTKDRDCVGDVASLTAGKGADVAFEAVGITPTVDLAIKSVRKGGAVSLIGNLSPKIEFPLQSVVTREIKVYGSCASSGEYPACLDMIARGAIQVAPIISAVTALKDAASWFERLHAQEPGVMKVIVKP